MKINSKRWLTALAATTAVFLSGTANATMINMIIGNFDVQFNGNTEELFEVADPDVAFDENGGSFPLDGDDAQAVSSVDFEFGGSLAGGLSTAMGDTLFSDLLVEGLGSSLTLGTFQSGQGNAGGTLDWFTDTGEFLRLSLTSIDYVAIETPLGFGPFFFTATASVTDQNLPFDLSYTDEVVVTYTASDAMYTGGGEMMLSSGALTISGDGIVIPEPTTAGLMASLAMAGFAGLQRRR